MGEHANYGWLRLLLSLVIAGVGLVWIFAPSVRRQGRSTGDRGLEWENCRLAFPLVTCLFLGLLGSLVRGLVRPFRD
jgi:hypothetical protein